MIKNLPIIQGTQEMEVRSLGREDPLEKEMATHSSILAWRITMDGGAWWATVQGVTKSWTQLNDFTLCLLAKRLSVLIYSLVIRGVFEYPDHKRKIVFFLYVNGYLLVLTAYNAILR